MFINVFEDEAAKLRMKKIKRALKQVQGPDIIEGTSFKGPKKSIVMLEVMKWNLI